jgi:NAD(P)-dependent dehydrogenase (short-subunit alcohol dehydrogenase family)
MNISGKVALVSGGASGLGAASVKMILDSGGRAAIVDRNEELGKRFAAEFGDRARFFAADVTDTAAIQRAVDGAVEAFGA